VERKSDFSYGFLYRWLGVLQCPQCRGHFVVRGHGEARALQCANCAAQYALARGIPKLLKPERAESVQSFCGKYDRLRLQEGWASDAPEFYSRLPFEDRAGRHVAEWRLRAQSFRQVQTWLEKNYGQQSLRILDAGAGSGWMSRLLAESHEVLATDVNAGAHGLDAHAREHRCFMAVQAELERLPLAANSFDLVLANASAHYASEVRTFFAEAARVLRPGGKLIVMDSPVYRDEAAAAAAHERTRAYYAGNGVPELVQNYGGLSHELFIKPNAFDFVCLRRDFSEAARFKKWLREKLGKESAARFPIWIGERLRLPKDDWQPDRSRAGALLIHENKLLTYFFNDAQARYWRIPGRGIEEGETPEQTAVRELREEMGLHVTLQRAFGPYHLADKSHWYFFAAADHAQLPEENAAGFEEDCAANWLPLARLHEFDLRPAALKWELMEYFFQISRA
jgi:ubiquinone/menaquinone biosynthesis C-methylase UbiE/ADP-ribose pyrophosphatase YjhB (NUDIX family)/uncharacterized protein YbaR (Trm112 family)